MIRQARAFFDELYIAGAALLLVVMPAAAAWGTRQLARQTESNALIVIFLVAAIPLLTVPEILMDHYQFGGLLEPDIKMLESLKTSAKGNALYRRMLVFDMGRRGVMYVLMIILSALCNPGALWTIGYLTVLIGGGALAVSISIRIIRRYDGPGIMFLMVYLSWFLCGLVGGLAIGFGLSMPEKAVRAGRLLFLPGLLLIALAVLLAVHTTRKSLSAWKEQYND